MIDLGVFLVGAACGAALSYLKDRRLLHLYGDLVRELSGALQEQVEQMPDDAEGQARWLLPQAEKIREDEHAVVHW